MTVVIDCNILVICLTSKSPYHFLYQALIGGKFTLAVSVEILLEYEEIIQTKYGTATAGSLIALLKELKNVTQIDPFYRWNLMEADPDDNKYVDCAIAGKADYLVTADKHFSALRSISFPSVSIISIDEFLSMLKSF